MMDKWNLVEYDSDLFGYKNQIEDYKILKTTDKIPNINKLIKIDGRIYAPCYIDVEQKCFMAHEIKPSRYEEEIDINLICPYCGYQDRDSWDLENYGEKECDRCGALLEWETEITRTFTTKLVKKPEIY